MSWLDNLRSYIINLNSPKPPVQKGPVSAFADSQWNPQHRLANRLPGDYANFTNQDWQTYQNKYQLSPQDVSSTQDWVKNNDKINLNLYDYIQHMRQSQVPNTLELKNLRVNPQSR